MISIRRLVPALIAGLSAACHESTSPGDASTFSATITGATTARLSGSATASTASDWSRERVVQVTLPNAGQLSGIVLATAGSANAISFIRSGADLALGTFTLGPASAYAAGYVVRRADGLQLFTADSGTVSMAESGGRVSGTFTIYVNGYNVFPMPTTASVGQTITPIASGQSAMTITGAFNAARR